MEKLINVTNELRARIIATHIPCKVEIGGSIFQCVGVNVQDKMCLVVGSHLETGVPSLFAKDVDRCRLVLNPLLSISTEHAVALAEIDGIDCAGAVLGFRAFNREFCLLAFDVSGKTPQHKLMLRREHWDFLRFKEYDCGYGSISSLIDEAGIAISAPNPERSVATDAPSE